MRRPLVCKLRLHSWRYHYRQVGGGFSIACQRCGRLLFDSLWSVKR